MSNSPFKMALVLIGVLLGVSLLAIVTRPHPNPFIKQQIDGELLAWNAVRSQGWLIIHGTPVMLRLAGKQIGESPAPGCLASAYGRYEHSRDQQGRVFAAAVLVVECRNGGGKRAIEDAERRGMHDIFFQEPAARERAQFCENSDQLVLECVARGSSA